MSDMSTFAFLPRSIKNRKIEPTPKQDQVSASVASISKPAGPPTESEGQSSENARVELSSKGKEKAENTQSSTREDHFDRVSKESDLEDLARLVWLSLSDYALWSDADLRRKIDWAFQVDDDGDGVEPNRAGHDDDGFIPLSYLMKKSPIFLQAASTTSLAGHPEISYVKAIRAHVSDLVDVRLILTNEGPSGFGQNRWSTKKSPTGYEVRRKPTQSRFREYGKTDWHDLTIYVENIPISYRNISGVSKFVSSLLKSSSISKVQHVSFPPHHNDRPGTLPSCKGFALITLSIAKDVQFLLNQWLWDESLAKDEIKGKDGDSEEPDVFRREAIKFGLRCLSKGRWEELRTEYLLYRQQLVAELEADNEAQEKIHRNQPSVSQEAHQNSPMSQHDNGQPHSEPVSETPSQSKSDRVIFNASSPFPPECLVFLRNVHPETNKTTLRALFSQASKLVEGQTNASDGLDYMDYTKGLNSCYLRFSSPRHAASFVKYFTSNSLTQTSALDGEGKLVTGAPDAGSALLFVTPELLTGKREELCWQKVPEKVRRQAVEKALNAVQRSDEGHGAANHMNEGQGKKRKRGK